MAALRRCAEELARGRGQIVSITGEAGIGKSRLKNELRDNPPPNVRWLEGRCQAFTQTASYAPLVQILRTVFQLSGAKRQQVARTKLRVTLRSLVGGQVRAGAPRGGPPARHARRAWAVASGAMDPRALQSQLVLALRSIVEALAARGPIILTVEDLHWADPATIEILTVLSELTDFLPLMILVTSRPDSEGGGPGTSASRRSETIRTVSPSSRWPRCRPTSPSAWWRTCCTSPSCPRRSAVGSSSSPRAIHSSSRRSSAR